MATPLDHPDIQSDANKPQAPRRAPIAGPPPGLFDQPTNRPEESSTAGLDTGEGPGSEALRTPQPRLDEEDERERDLIALAAEGYEIAAEMLADWRARRAPVRATPTRPRAIDAPATPEEGLPEEEEELSLGEEDEEGFEMVEDFDVPEIEVGEPEEFEPEAPEEEPQAIELPEDEGDVSLEQ